MNAAYNRTNVKKVGNPTCLVTSLDIKVGATIVNVNRNTKNSRRGTAGVQLTGVKSMPPSRVKELLLTNGLQLLKINEQLKRTYRTDIMVTVVQSRTAASRTPPPCITFLQKRESVGATNKIKTAVRNMKAALVQPTPLTDNSSLSVLDERLVVRDAANRICRIKENYSNDDGYRDTNRYGKALKRPTKKNALSTCNRRVDLYWTRVAVVRKKQKRRKR